MSGTTVPGSSAVMRSLRSRVARPPLRSGSRHVGYAHRRTSRRMRGDRAIRPSCTIVTGMRTRSPRSGYVPRLPPTSRTPSGSASLASHAGSSCRRPVGHSSASARRSWCIWPGCDAIDAHRARADSRIGPVAPHGSSSPNPRPPGASDRTRRSRPPAATRRSGHIGREPVPVQEPLVHPPEARPHGLQPDRGQLAIADVVVGVDQIASRETRRGTRPGARACPAEGCRRHPGSR